MSNNKTYTYRPTSDHPIRFENLRPGSYFKIVSEPSRGLKKVQDIRIFRKDLHGFFAEHPVTKEACCLMPHDLVMPYRRIKKDERK